MHNTTQGPRRRSGTLNWDQKTKAKPASLQTPRKRGKDVLQSCKWGFCRTEARTGRIWTHWGGRGVGGGGKVRRQKDGFRDFKRSFDLGPPERA